MNPLALLFPILLPVLAGGAMPVLARRSARLLRFAVAFVTALVSAAVWYLIFTCGTEEVCLLKMSEYFSLRLRFDSLGRFFAGMIATLWPFTVCYAFEYMEDDPRQGIFYMFFTMAYGVTLGVAMAGNLFTLYCFYELLTLATVPLVHHPQTSDAVRAARTYFLYSLGGAAFAFLSMLYAALGMTGSESRLTSQLFWLLGFFGFGVKAAVFPTYIWLPRASVAPTPVTALLHAVAVVKSGVFAIIRLTYGTYGTGLLAASPAADIAMGFTVFTILFGAVMSLKETHLKRRLAYSTVDNLSYILFGVLLLSEGGLSAALMHMAFHAQIKILAFFAAGAILHKTGKEFNREMDGLALKMPLTCLCFTAAALGLTGIPPFSGFVSKWYLLRAGAESGTPISWIGCAVILVSALLTAVYMLSPAVHAWFPYAHTGTLRGSGDKNTAEVCCKGADGAESPAGFSKKCDPGWHMLFPMAVLAVSILLAGLLSGKIREITDLIARTVSSGF